LTRLLSLVAFLAIAWGGIVLISFEIVGGIQ
jgi:hypothetical protein